MAGGTYNDRQIYDEIEVTEAEVEKHLPQYIREDVISKIEVDYQFKKMINDNLTETYCYDDAFALSECIDNNGFLGKRLCKNQKEAFRKCIAKYVTNDEYYDASLKEFLRRRENRVRERVRAAIFHKKYIERLNEKFSS